MSGEIFRASSMQASWRTIRAFWVQMCSKNSFSEMECPRKSERRFPRESRFPPDGLRSFFPGRGCATNSRTARSSCRRLSTASVAERFLEARAAIPEKRGGRAKLFECGANPIPVLLNHPRPRDPITCISIPCFIYYGWKFQSISNWSRNWMVGGTVLDWILNSVAPSSLERCCLCSDSLWKETQL